MDRIKRGRRLPFLLQAAVFVVLVVLAVVFHDSARWLVSAAFSFLGVCIGTELVERRKRRSEAAG
ncbi:hypothetical protein [Lentzea jiangxiensis]|uniref:Uncharacterized protein n=1 Tax=Lentzea jiangxiensis TaxID=641025 RepID=A0A1H0J3Z4_9PSEU|nr:hypothetical protein [Lentzea jiangxiensis]SDO38180.1 hypothetical protein SAMN05421507_102350 [Lentzea jiangxiensis]